VLSSFGAFVNAEIKAKRVKQICDESAMFVCEEHEQFAAEALDDYLRDEGVLRYNLLFRSNNGGDATEALRGKPHTVLLMSIKNGNTIVVYSSLSHCEAVDAKATKGLLISTHSMKAYPLKEGSSPIRNSKESIVVGNDEIAISKTVTENMTVKTNFGRNSAFEIATDTNIDMCGCSEGEEIAIRGFEVYEIELQNCEMREEKSVNPENEPSTKGASNKTVNVKALQRENKDLKDKVETDQNTIRQLRVEKRETETK
jgi:hypothetical protein